MFLTLILKRRALPLSSTLNRADPVAAVWTGGTCWAPFRFATYCVPSATLAAAVFWPPALLEPEPDDAAPIPTRAPMASPAAARGMARRATRPIRFEYGTETPSSDVEAPDNRRPERQPPDRFHPLP